MTNPFLNHGMDGVPLGDEEINGVSQPQLPSLAGFDTAESIENRAIKQIPTNSYQI